MENIARAYKEEELSEKMKTKQGIRDYRSDLIQQIDYLNSIKEGERRQDYIDYKTSLLEESNYQNRVIEAKKKILNDYVQY